MGTGRAAEAVLAVRQRLWRRRPPFRARLDASLAPSPPGTPPRRQRQVTHEWRSNEQQLRFTDTRLDERARGISLKMSPLSLVLEGASGKARCLLRRAALPAQPVAPLP